MLTSWTNGAARPALTAREMAEHQVFAQREAALVGLLAEHRRLATAEVVSPLHEARLRAQGGAANGGCFPSGIVAGCQPEASITLLRGGDRITLCAARFVRLSGAFPVAVTASAKART